MLKRTITVIMLTLLAISVLTSTSNLCSARSNRTLDELLVNDFMDVGQRTTVHPSSFPWGDWQHYHNYTEIVDTLLYLNDTYPSIVDVYSIGKSWQNRDIYCIRLTNESNTHPKPKVFFVGYHHAREPISAELPLYFAVMAATEYLTNATITRMLDYCEIYIVVALNVDGLGIRIQNEWQRKNAHPFDEDGDGQFDEDPPCDMNGDGYIEDLWKIEGENWTFITWEGNDTDYDGTFDLVGGVDLNRNYGYQWNATVDSGSDDPNAEDFRGLSPFSEPETQAIRDLAMQNDFKYTVSFHSGAEDIVYPWGYANLPTPDDALFIEAAADMSSLTGAIYERSGAWYTTSGVWDDWLYGNRSAYAFTCEIYGNDSAWQYRSGPGIGTYWERGIFQAFNPNEADIEPVVQRWLPIFTYITDRAITEAYDVATTNVTSLKTTVGQGYSMRINVTVTNQGDFTEAFNVTVYANTTFIGSESVTLGSHSSTTVTFTWNTTGFSEGNYHISAVATIIPGETHTIDNNLADGYVQVGIPGDLYVDGAVDSTDLGILGYSWSTSIGDPAYYAVADIDDSGSVDSVDLGIMGAHWGEMNPSP